MATINRANRLGYVSWAVMLDDVEVLTFDKYSEAAEFVRFLNEV